MMDKVGREMEMSSFLTVYGASNNKSLLILNEF